MQKRVTCVEVNLSVGCTELGWGKVGLIKDGPSSLKGYSVSTRCHNGS